MGSLAENVNHRDAAALASLREADPVIAALIDANPDYDPGAWLARLNEFERLSDEEVIALGPHPDSQIRLLTAVWDRSRLDVPALWCPSANGPRDRHVRGEFGEQHKFHSRERPA